VEGLDGLSIARLAEAVGMSKSGLFAHFGSKEELQLATVATASELFDEIVINPALGAPTGIERLRALCENYLRHVEDSVYPGGCFFASAAAELDTRLGPVRDLAIEVVGDWLEQQRKAVRDAQAEGAIDPSEDPEQLAFELEAYLMAANQMFVISQDPAPIEQARRAIARRLLAATPTAG
jgi:AcrR family transcriptional regulator